MVRGEKRGDFSPEPGPVKFFVKSSSRWVPSHAGPEISDFGKNDKPRIGDSPDANAAWLDHVLREVVQGPMAIVACGHAAGYVLRHFAGQKENVPHMALVAPTWRGPLPTMMNGKRPDWLKSVRAAVGNPIVGHALYNLNMNERVVEMEPARHCGGHDDAKNV